MSGALTSVTTPTHSLTGTGALTRLALRADRVRLTVWIVALTLYQLSSSSAVRSVYATAADRQVRAELISSPTAAFLAGPGYGIDNYSFGAMFANEQTQYLLVALVILTVTLVVRHTRADEESGRAELIRSAPVGRHAALAAALIVATVAVAAFAVASTGVLVAGGLALGSSALLAGGIALAALSFAGVAALTAQLTEHARTATGAALAVVVVAYALRALGDTQRRGGSAFSWASPLGWVQQTKPFVDPRPWPLVLYALVLLPTTALAFAVESRRDFGAGLIPARPGRSTAPAWLASPLALVWQLERSSVLAWTVGVGAASAAFGGVIGQAQTSLSSYSDITDVLRDRAGTLTEALVSTILLVISLAVVGFAVSCLGRARTEEVSGRADTVLVTGISRTRWFAATMVVTVGASTMMLTVTGVMMGLTASSSTSIPFGAVLGAALSYLPAVLVFVGIAALLFGLSPDAVRLAYVPVVYAIVVGVVGVLLRLPRWAVNLSPLSHVPALGSVTATPLLALTAVAAAMASVAIAAYRRRDLRAS